MILTEKWTANYKLILYTEMMQHERSCFSKKKKRIITVIWKKNQTWRSKKAHSRATVLISSALLYKYSS